MQDSTSSPWPPGGKIGGLALAKSLGVADDEIEAHNGGNDTALGVPGFIRAVLTTTSGIGTG